MSFAMTDRDFWSKLEELVARCELVIDRPQGAAHPRRASIIYPLDYGYLAGTQSGDGDGIDVWRGSLPGRRVTGVICTVDGWKRDAEVKVLLSCTPREARLALKTHNTGEQQGILVERAPGAGAM